MIVYTALLLFYCNIILHIYFSLCSVYYGIAFALLARFAIGESRAGGVLARTATLNVTVAESDAGREMA